MLASFPGGTFLRYVEVKDLEARVPIHQYRVPIKTVQVAEVKKGQHSKR